MFTYKFMKGFNICDIPNNPSMNYIYTHTTL